MRDPRLHTQALAALEAAEGFDPLATVPDEEIAEVRDEQREAGLEEPKEDVHEVRDLEVGGVPCRLHLHDSTLGPFQLPGLAARAALITHPGPTVGYRLAGEDGSLAYLPDHEPALGVRSFPDARSWTSGWGLANNVDLLVHDAQYTEEEYAARVGWGHSTLADAIAFARHAGARRLLAFHHDPAHDDDFLDRWVAGHSTEGLRVEAAREGMVIELSRQGSGEERRTLSA